MDTLRHVTVLRHYAEVLQNNSSTGKSKIEQFLVFTFVDCQNRNGIKYRYKKQMSYKDCGNIKKKNDISDLSLLLTNTNSYD